MISIECHRSGERCPGKREFDNRIEINRVRSGEIDVAIPFKESYMTLRLVVMVELHSGEEGGCKWHDTEGRCFR